MSYKIKFDDGMEKIVPSDMLFDDSIPVSEHKKYIFKTRTGSVGRIVECIKDSK